MELGNDPQGVPPAPPPLAPRAPARRGGQELAREAEVAQGAIALLLARTRRRALWLATVRGVGFAGASLLFALLAGALASSFASAAVARVAAALLFSLGLAGVVVWSLRSPLQRIVLDARSPAAVA